MCIWFQNYKNYRRIKRHKREEKGCSDLEQPFFYFKKTCRFEMNKKTTHKEVRVQCQKYPER